jgi:hypothetical protein
MKNLNEPQKPKLVISDVISCSCNNGIIVCPGCGGEQSKHGVCAGCKGIGIVTCGKCGGKNKIQRLTLYEGGDKDAQPSAYLKSKLDAQLFKFGTQPHFCIAYVIGCKKII